MQFDLANLPKRDIYLWMTRLINPRPIAWVSTLSKDGDANLAPFSFFNGVGSNPPTLVFCPANKRDGTPKDTLANIQQTGEFVVNIVTMSLAESMHTTAAELESDVDEFEFAGIAKQESHKIAVPRVANALAAFECEMFQVISLATGPGAANLVIGRIVSFYVSDQIIDQATGQFEATKLPTIGRMGDSDYTQTTDRFKI